MIEHIIGVFLIVQNHQALIRTKINKELLKRACFSSFFLRRQNILGYCVHKSRCQPRTETHRSGEKTFETEAGS